MTPGPITVYRHRPNWSSTIHACTVPYWSHNYRFKCLGFDKSYLLHMKWKLKYSMVIHSEKPIRNNTVPSKSIFWVTVLRVKNKKTMSTQPQLLHKHGANNGYMTWSIWTMAMQQYSWKLNLTKITNSTVKV